MMSLYEIKRRAHLLLEGAAVLGFFAAPYVAEYYMNESLGIPNTVEQVEAEVKGGWR